MTERVEPTLSSQVDIDEPERPVGKARAARPSRPAPVSQRVVEVKSPLAPLALTAAVIALGFVGLLFWQVFEIDNERKALAGKLQSAEERVANLEEKLTVSGDESEQSLASLGAQVKTLNDDVKENVSEIKKLWGVAYDRNRKAIEQTNNQVAELEKGLASLKSTLEKDQKTLQAALADVKGELAVMSEVQESQQAVLSQSRNFATDLKTLRSDLTRRVQANEEAIKAIDAFRLQVNRQLLQMGGTSAQ